MNLPKLTKKQLIITGLVATFLLTTGAIAMKANNTPVADTQPIKPATQQPTENEEPAEQPSESLSTVPETADPIQTPSKDEKRDRKAVDNSECIAKKEEALKPYKPHYDLYQREFAVVRQQLLDQIKELGHPTPSEDKLRQMVNMRDPLNTLVYAYNKYNQVASEFDC